MAMAQITLTGCSTYKLANGTVYKKNVPVTSTSSKEIADAKSCGYFQVLDLELERAQLEDTLAKTAAQLDSVKRAEAAQKKGQRGRSSPPQTRTASAEGPGDDSDGGE